MNVFNKDHVKKLTSTLSRTYLLYENHIFKDAADKNPITNNIWTFAINLDNRKKIALLNNFVSVSQALYWDFCRPWTYDCVCCQNHREFICATALFYTQNTVSGSYLPPLAFTVTPSPLLMEDFYILCGRVWYMHLI